MQETYSNDNNNNSNFTNNLINTESYIGFKPAPNEPQLNVNSAFNNRSTTYLNPINGTKKIRIENNVFTTSFKRSLNLRLLHDLSKFDYGGQYNKKNFAAIIFRYRQPRSASLVFANGDVVFTGLKNSYQPKLMLIDLIKLLEKAGYIDINFKKIKLKLQNMVASVTLTFGVDLKALKANQHQFDGTCSYIKKIFPGAVIQLAELGKISCTVFEYGRLIITGVKDYYGVKRTLKKVIPILYKFKIDNIDDLEQQRQEEEQEQEMEIDI
jgi:TATA-box binding protein (TBP) (component of TFIID and TFIIIB)